MKDTQMEAGSLLQHDLRREFHNMLGVLKIIKHDSIIKDAELKEMLDMCLSREQDVVKKFEELAILMEKVSE
jgi:hypothetical protein